MNKQVKQAAVAKYSKLYAAGASEAEIKEAIAETFKAEEVDEVYAAVAAGGKDDEADTSGEPEAKEEKKNGNGKKDPNAIRKFKKFAAHPIWKFRVNEDTGEKERYLHTVEKRGGEISEHNMYQRQADELNSQVENSGFYYFG